MRAGPKAEGRKANAIAQPQNGGAGRTQRREEPLVSAEQQKAGPPGAPRGNGTPSADSPPDPVTRCSCAGGLRALHPSRTWAADAGACSPPDTGRPMLRWRVASAPCAAARCRLRSAPPLRRKMEAAPRPGPAPPGCGSDWRRRLATPPENLGRGGGGGPGAEPRAAVSRCGCASPNS